MGQDDDQVKKKRKDRMSRSTSRTRAKSSGNLMPGMPFSPYMMQQQQWAAYMAMMSGRKQKSKKDKKKKKKKRKRETSSSSSSDASAEKAPTGPAASDANLAADWLKNGSAPAAQASAASVETGLDEFIAGNAPVAKPSAAELPTRTETTEQGERRQRRSHGWDDAPKELQAPSTAQPAPEETAAESKGPEELQQNTASAGGPPEKLYGDAWEEPRSKTGLKLVGELAPETMKWTYALNDESRRSFCGFLPRTLSKDVCASFFEKARDGATWLQPVGPNGPIPRKTAWMVSSSCSCHYRYGRIEVEPQVYPQWMVTLMQWIMPCCGIHETHEWPNSCNLNLYQDGGMSVGWHADDEQLFQGKFRDCKIISLSLGTTRSFELRLNWSDASKEQSTIKLSLGDGDLCTMEGMVQKHLQHRVPRENDSEGPRINLTWRWIVKHTPRCPAVRERP